MPKFHFEIIDGHKIEDPRSMEVASEQQAKGIAEEMAKQIANHVKDNSLRDVVVKTSTEKVIHKARIKPDL